MREQYDKLISDHGLRWDWRVALEAGWLQERPALVLNVLRIVQEALTSTIKHAHASVVTVTAEQCPDGSTVVTVGDDGPGGNGDGRATGGLAHMQERAEAAGFRVTAADGGAIRIEVPA